MSSNGSSAMSVRGPMQDALYAVFKFVVDDCTNLSAFVDIRRLYLELAREETR